jgi:hypothetical protein
MIGAWMDGGKRSDRHKVVASCAASDQRVEAVLRGKLVGHIWSADGESGYAPVSSVGCVGGIPRLMCPVEVADTEVNYADRRRFRHAWQVSAEVGQIPVWHPFIFRQPALRRQADLGNPTSSRVLEVGEDVACGPRMLNR